MRAGGSMVTCLPVQLDQQDDWESAIFFRLFGKESEADLLALSNGQSRFPIGIETDLIQHESASVVVISVEAEIIKGDSLRGEILLTSGGATAHFEALKLLSSQPRLCWFFTDENFSVVHSQEHPLNEQMHAEFSSLLQEASSRDAVIRMTGKYDAHNAFSSVVKHYDFRAKSAL